MDRATFEKIVGGKTATVTTEENGCVEVWFDGNGEISIAQGADVVELAEPTPFRLRCLLHGLGIKCDWDQPVNFERLMELEGALSMSFNESEVYVGHYSFEVGQIMDRKWWCNPRTKDGFPITTMRQVHLLLEAASVSV